MFRFGKRTKPDQGERGQSLVEAAIGITLLLITLFGLVDLGRLYYVLITLADGAGEAALYLSINPDCWDANGFNTSASNITGDIGSNADQFSSASEFASQWYYDGSGTACDGTENAVWRITNAGGGMVDWSGIAPSDIQLEVHNTSKDGDRAQDTITVSIPYSFTLVTPLIPTITGVNPITLWGVASQTVVQN